MFHPRDGLRCLWVGGGGTGFPNRIAERTRAGTFPDPGRVQKVRFRPENLRRRRRRRCRDGAITYAVRTHVLHIYIYVRKYVLSSGFFLPRTCRERDKSTDGLRCERYLATTGARDTFFFSTSPGSGAKNYERTKNFLLQKKKKRKRLVGGKGRRGRAKPVRTRGNSYY